MLHDLLLLAAAICLVVVSYAWGYRRGTRLWREEQYQRTLEALAQGRDPKEALATAPRAVVRSARFERSHLWSDHNNGDS